MTNIDCQASVLTARGRGAIAVISITGTDSSRILATLFSPANSGMQLHSIEPGRIVFGRWQGTDPNQAGEELVVCRRGPHRWEVHCHGGSAAVNAILNALATHGASIRTWSESFSWAGPEGDATNVNRIQQEAIEALSQVDTELAAAILLRQYSGELAAEVDSIQKLLRDGMIDEPMVRIEALLRNARAGMRLTGRWKVVLAGPPNVGKSSLINALLGYERAIVFDQPGTTRDVVKATTAFDGWPVELADTAGLREAADAIEAAGIQKAESQLAAADIILWVHDIRDWDANAKNSLLRPELCQPQWVVANKSDLVAEIELPENVIATSAAKNVGIDRIMAVIAESISNDIDLSVAVPFTHRHISLLSKAIDSVRVSDFTNAIAMLDQLVSG